MLINAIDIAVVISPSLNKKLEVTKFVTNNINNVKKAQIDIILCK